MKRILKKGLISIVVAILLINFLSANVLNVSYGFDLGDIFSGLIGIITWIPRATLMAALIGVNKLITAFASFGLDGIDNYGVLDVIGFTEDSYVTPFHIFFNEIPLLDVNFLDINSAKDGSVVKDFRTAVAGWYYTIRLIAMMILAVVLIYIGIRMALSTIASEKAMYKKMLVDWMTSLALLFLLHYIMLFTFACNNALVNAIKAACEASDLDAIMLTLSAQAFGIEIIGAVAAMIIFGIIIGQTLSFMFAYVKRMITIGFLIMIAPLITVTYSIDKIGDNKAQALNNWLKEFVYNVLIQPFHCILFAAFVGVAYRLIDTSLFDDVNIASMILAICCIQFIKDGEKLVQKIFGFNQASSLTSMAMGAGMTMAAISKGTQAGQAVGAGAAKTQKFLATNKDKIAKATGDLTKKFAKVTTDAEGNKVLTERGKKAAAKEAANKTGGKAKDERANNTEAYQKAEESIMQRYKTKDEKLSEKATRMKERRETKEREAAVEQATKDLRAKGVTRPPNEEEIQSADRRLKAERQAKEDKKAERVEKFHEATAGARKITGAVGHFVGEHGKEIASLSSGAIVGMIGMGAGGMSGAIAGAKFGSGLAQGYMANTTATLQREVEGGATAVSNLHSDEEGFDMEAKTFELFATAQNGGFDKIDDKLNAILNKLSGLNSDQKKEFKSTIQMQLLKDPSKLDLDFIQEQVKHFGVDDADGSTFAGMKEYATLAADASFAKTIQNATATSSLQEIATAATTVTVQNNTVVNNNTSQVDMDITQNIETTEPQTHTDRPDTTEFSQQGQTEAENRMPTPPVTNNTFETQFDPDHMDG